MPIPRVPLNVDDTGQAGSIVPRPGNITYGNVNYGSGSPYGGGGGNGTSPLYALLAKQAKIKNSIAKQQLAMMKQEARQNRDVYRTQETPESRMNQVAKMMRMEQANAFNARRRQQAEEYGKAGMMARALYDSPGRAHGLRGPDELQNLQNMISAIGIPAAHQGLMQTGQLLAGQSYGGGRYGGGGGADAQPPTSPYGMSRPPEEMLGSTYGAGRSLQDLVAASEQAGGAGYARPQMRTSPSSYLPNMTGGFETGSLPGTVPETGPYELHEGEIVLEKDQVDGPLLNLLIGDKLRKMISGQIKKKKSSAFVGDKKGFESGTLGSYESGTLGSYAGGTLEEQERMVDRVRKLGGLNVNERFKGEYEGAGLTRSNLRRKGGNGRSPKSIIQALIEEGFDLEPDDEAGLYERLGASYDAKRAGLSEPGISGTGDQFYGDIEDRYADYAEQQNAKGLDDLMERETKPRSYSNADLPSGRALPLEGAGSVDDVLQGSGAGEDVARFRAAPGAGPTPPGSGERGLVPRGGNAIVPRGGSALALREGGAQESKALVRSGGQRVFPNTVDDVVKLIAEDKGVSVSSVRKMPKKLLLGAAIATGVVVAGTALYYALKDEAEEEEPGAAPTPMSQELEEASAGSNTPTGLGHELLVARQPDQKMGLMNPENSALMRMIGKFTGDQEGPVVNRGIETPSLDPQLSRGRYVGQQGMENMKGDLRSAAGPGEMGGPLGAMLAPTDYAAQREDDLTRGGTAQSGGPEYFRQPEPSAAPADEPQDYQSQLASIAERVGNKDFGSAANPLTLDGTGEVPEGTINDFSKGGWREQQDDNALEANNKSSAQRINSYLARSGRDMEPSVYKQLRDESKRLTEISKTMREQRLELQDREMERFNEYDTALLDYNAELAKAEGRIGSEQEKMVAEANHKAETVIRSLQNDLFSAAANGKMSDKNVEAQARRLAQLVYKYSNEGEHDYEELAQFEQETVEEYLALR